MHAAVLVMSWVVQKSACLLQVGASDSVSRRQILQTAPVAGTAGRVGGWLSSGAQVGAYAHPCRSGHHLVVQCCMLYRSIGR